jgi:hypothetical protein
LAVNYSGDANDMTDLDKITGVLPGRWDWPALRAGAMVALVFAIPLTVLAAVVDSNSGALNALFFFGAMLGFVLGGGCAAWAQRTGTPLSHGVVSACGTYLAVQAVFVAIRLAGGDSVNWFTVFFTLGLVSVSGMFGGVLGSRLQARGFVPSSQRSR